MFTGLITDVGHVVEVEPRGEAGDMRLAIETKYDTSTIELGASVACSGCCLTVVAKTATTLSFDVSGETLSKTKLGQWQVGTRLNMERSLRAGDELGGHLVSGHVDGTGHLISRHDEDGSWRLTFDAPEELAPFIAAKGSIVLDGVSLTVNEVEGCQFGVNIIPHTQSETALGDLAPGDPVNLEIDMLARYVARLLEMRS